MNTPLEELFMTGAKMIDNLDIYRSMEDGHIHYTSQLMKSSANLDSIDKSIKNVKSEISKVKQDSASIIDALKAVQKELKA